LLIGNLALAVGPWLVRNSGTGPIAAAHWRLLLAVPFLYFAAYLTKQSIKPGRPKIWILLVLGSLFFAADLGSWHIGIEQTKLANATLFGNSASIIFVVYGYLIARSLPSRLQLVAIALAVAGAFLLMASSYQLAAKYFIGDLFSLLAGVLYAAFLVAMLSVRNHMGTWPLLAHSSLIGAFPLLAMAYFMGENIVPQDWTAVFVLALTSQLIGQGLLIYAILHFSPLVFGLALLSQPAIAALLGWAAFDETVTATDLAGMVAVAVALILVRLPEKQQQKLAEPS